MNKLTNLLFLTCTSSLIFGCAPKLDKKYDIPKTVVKPVKGDEKKKVEVILDLQTQVEEIKQSPTITMVLVPSSDVQVSIQNLQKVGGKIIYDPNNGNGSSIPFYIAELTPKLINNTEAMLKLDLKSAAIDGASNRISVLEDRLNAEDMNYTSFIPTDSVGIDALGDKEKLGEGVTVAVIDTGIDASHPAFGNRVAYWYDATQETRTELKKVTVTNNTTTVDINGEIKKISIPAEINKGEVYVAAMSESEFKTQLADSQKYGKGFLDLNSNNSDDTFLVVVSIDGNDKNIYFDVNADLKLSGGKELVAKIDYNETDSNNREKGMISFPTRNNILKYPILLEEVDGKMFINVAKTEGMHGTHVAGIIAADDKANNLLGAAPLAKLMSLKVCSGISCTDSAIIKGLYKAFYNGKIVPDVVNISLGSHEKYKKDVYSYLLNDLSAKFGTVFFISASNSGPGFRSLNHFGNSGPVVMVGANVSKKTLNDQYNLPRNASTQDENLLFFSSLGPSFTSEMKPNIIAPGAAISAIPAGGNYMAQANGTSMSSPIAAGTFAAVLSELRKSDQSLFNTIDTQRVKSLAGSKVATKTLLPYVYAMRDALQNSAIEQPDLTRAQQGFGLITAGPAKDLLKTYLSELESGDRDYFEIVINDNQKTYDRSSNVKKVQGFKLSLGEDGERSKQSLANIISSGVEVSLNRVEIINSLGEVKVLTTPNEITKYFSIVDRGNESNKLLAKNVTFNNRRNLDFHSRRNLDKMSIGSTYIAHYMIKSKGVVLSNLLDVVHRPIVLGRTIINAPAVENKQRESISALSLKDVKIETNTFHRYPILVTKDMSQLDIKLAISDSAQGKLYVQLYNTDGKEVAFEQADSSSLYNVSMASIKSSTLKKNKVQAGVWELTVSSSSSSWLSESKYDLLIEGRLFGASILETLVKKGESTLLSVNEKDSKLDKVMLVDVKQVIPYKVDVMAGHISYQPLVLPKMYKGKLSVFIKNEDKPYWGKVIPKLYTKNGDKFVALEQAKFDSTKKAFNVELKDEKTVYFAIETISNYSDSGKLESVNKINVNTVFEAKSSVKFNSKISRDENLEVATVRLDVENIEFDSLGIEESYLTGELLLISGEVQELKDIEGKSVLTISNKTKVDKVILKITK